MKSKRSCNNCQTSEAAGSPFIHRKMNSDLMTTVLVVELLLSEYDLVCIAFSLKINMI